MKKFVNKFLAVVVSFVTAIAMVPLGSGGVAYAETSKVTDNVKYFSTTMYNFNASQFNAATDNKLNNNRKSSRSFYFINGNGDAWAKDKGQTGYVNYGDPGDKTSARRDAYNVLVQGIVEDRLTSKGDLQFKYTNAGVFSDAKTDISGREVYQNVQFPFVKTTNGYYEFNSASNHVHVDTSNKLGQQLTLYTGGQSIDNYSSFFPFNADGASSTDIHFGMNMSVPFYMNESDLDPTNTTNPTKFEFSGDDDVWVFVNNKLVLDLGGIHDAIGGSINFNTGAIEYTYTKDSSVKVKARQGNKSAKSTVASKNLYKNCGITKSELISGENNLQIFYLERGGAFSNCKIRFNLKQKDTLEVSKALGATTPYTSSDFQFQLLKKNGSSYEPVTNKTYALYNGSSLIPGNYATDAEGKFNLKAGYHANFTENATGDYKVVELTGGYDTKWTLTKQVSKSDDEVNSTVEGKSASVQIAENSGGSTKYVLSCVNSADVTLADDTIVLDYGKPVQYDVTTNDSSKSKENGTIVGIGTADLATDATKVDTKYAEGLGKDVELNNGNITINSEGIVTYTPTKYMSSVDKANYAVNYKVNNSQTDRYAYATVNVLPATSVYYEDDFGKINDDGKKETVIEWTGKWSTATSDEGKTTKDNTYQDSTNGLSDGNNGYGWDSSYKDDSQYSNGSAQKTTLNDTDNKSATATFTFTGTGVDVYTKTDATTGTVRAILYKVEDGEEVAKKILIMDNKSVKDYYQIPTLYFSDLEYGTYKVDIKVTTAAGQDRTTYYLDGIRVYNPLGLAPSDQIVKDAYEDAGEYNATIKTVRDILIDADSFNAGTTTGAVFIDETNNEETQQPTGTSGKTTSVTTYEKIGPKNEVYLDSGQAIAFAVNSGYENLFIGAKAPNGTTTMVVSNGDSAKEVTLNSASDRYYKIDAKSGENGEKYVVVKNMGPGLLSITKARATGENYTFDMKSNARLLNYVSDFSSLPVSKTDESGMVISKDNGNVDIDNSSDKDNNQQEENNNNNTNKPSSFWDKIMNSFKHWFR